MSKIVLRKLDTERIVTWDGQGPVTVYWSCIDVTEEISRERIPSFAVACFAQGFAIVLEESDIPDELMHELALESL